MTSNASQILQEFDANKSRLEDFSSGMERTLSDLLRVHNIRVHSIKPRVKDRTSLAAKIGRLEKNYESLWEVTDLVGIRVITYLEDEVDIVGNLIKAEFDFDPDHSIDKRRVLASDRFGYLSLHHVCGFSDLRLRLPEFARHAGLKCEIQIRSILQHAWAEIEHDLGYKAGAAIPDHLRRRFSRLAGLLEIGDAEFMRLRDELAAYVEATKREIAESPDRVELNDVTLNEFISSSELVREIDKEIADSVQAEITEGKFDTLTAQLKLSGLETIDDIANALAANRGVVVSQWIERMQGRSATSTIKTLQQGISLFHLSQVLALKEKGREGLQAILDLLAGPEGSTSKYSQFDELIEAMERGGVIPKT